MDDLERELKVGFLDEAAQLLDDAEQCFLQLESASDDPSLIDKIFRLAHNLKGSGRAVGFSQLAEFTHQLESLLLKIKNKELQITSPVVTLLLSCNDHVKNWIQTLKADLDAQVDSVQLVAEIQAQMSGAGAQPAEAPPAAESAAPATEIPQAAFGGSPYPSADAFVDQSLVAAITESTPVPASPSSEPLLSQDELVSAMAAGIFDAPAAPVAPPAPPPKPASPAKAAEAKAPASGGEDESIRVSLKRLEDLLNYVGELVILQTVLNQQRHLIESPLIQRTIVQLAKITKDIQEISMSLRMIPLKQTFQKMQRIVRDTSKALSKNVVIEISGEQTELDKTVVDQLGDPLVHLIRNAVDHGLESNEERKALGKPEVGHVRLGAYHRGGQIVIEVRDDGKGLDAKKLTAKAIEKGILKPGTVLPDKEAYLLIFAAGFSTKTEVTEVSGRGVGMDVVRTNIEKKLHGEIQLETELGKGSTFRIILPLTLAIIDGMVVRSGEERYIVPLAHVHESLQPKSEDVHITTNMGEILSLRGEHLPLYRLNGILGRAPKGQKKAATDCIAIVVRQGEKPFSVLVDDIIGQQQIVIKQLGQEIRNLKGVSGGAILGDGRAALILDLNDLADRAINGAASTSKGAA